MVSTFSELKVLSYKLRASFYHVYVLFHNQPSVDAAPTPPRRPSTPPGLASTRQTKVDKGKAPALGSPIPDFGQSSMHTPLEGGPVGGIHSTNTEPPTKSPPANFLVPAQDFIPVAFSCFQEASNLSEKLLWGSHPLRLSVKVEFAAFLYDCMQDYDASRNMAKATITEVYKAQEGMDDEMFQDAADLVSVLGGMANRGIGRGGERAYDSSNESTPIKSGSSQSSDRTIGPSGNAASAEEPPQAPIIHTPIIQAPTPQAPSPRTPIAQAPPTDQDPHTQTPNLQVPGVSQVPQPAFPSPDMVNPIWKNSERVTN